MGNGHKPTSMEHTLGASFGEKLFGLGRRCFGGESVTVLQVLCEQIRWEKGIFSERLHD